MFTPEDVEVLKLARAKIADPTRWLQKRGYGKFHNNECVNSSIDDAECFCLGGAIFRAQRELLGRFEVRATESSRYNLLEKNMMPFLKVDHWPGKPGVVSFNGIVNFNDDAETRHEDVLALLDKVISEATSQVTESPTPAQ